MRTDHGPGESDDLSMCAAIAEPLKLMKQAGSIMHRARYRPHAWAGRIQKDKCCHSRSATWSRGRV